jgi:hypothetical protein
MKSLPQNLNDEPPFSLRYGEDYQGFTKMLRITGQKLAIQRFYEVHKKNETVSEILPT